MATVIKKCSRCKKAFEVTGNYKGIGVPFKICPYCDEIIIDNSDDEWELKDTSEKIGFYFTMFWTAILYGLLIPIIYLIFNELSDNKPKEDIFFYFWILGILLFSIIVYRIHLKDIKESEKRMKDPNYRLMLKKIGLLN